MTTAKNKLGWGGGGVTFGGGIYWGIFAGGKNEQIFG